MTAVVRALCFLVLAWQVAGQSKYCDKKEHDYFDIESLLQMQYWQFTVSDPSMCINGTDDDTCFVSFGVCQSVPQSVCPGAFNDAGVCMEVNHDTDSYHYDLGRSEFAIIDDNITNETGFYILYEHGPSLTGVCNSSITTIVVFSCNLDNEWNLNDHDVTPHLNGFIANPFDECQFIVYLNYSGACIKQTPVIPDICSLKSYDLLTLSNPEGWNAVVDKQYCFTADNNTVKDTCNLLFSFCKPLPNGQCPNSVFCQDPNLDKSLSFGTYNHHIKVFENDDGEGFTITNVNGTKTKDCPDGLFSTLIFVCNSTARWTDEDSNPTQDISKFIKAQPDIDNCQYIVRFNYSGACSPLTPLPPASTAKEISNIFGWIVLGIFLIAISYVVLGVMIQAARGKRGMELIPNLSIWKPFVIYILEGFQFTLDVVTCKLARGKNISKVDYEKL